MKNQNVSFKEINEFHLIFNRIPFPELTETEHFAKRDLYNKFLGELVKSAIEISPENCYSTGNITMPTTKKLVWKELNEIKKRNNYRIKSNFSHFSF